MNNYLMCPSTMCMDFDNLAKDVKLLEEAGIDIFHNDVMDGTFVPNITLGINDIKAIRRNTDKMIDVHLMIENPMNKVDWFIDAGCDLVYIHAESERYVAKTLAHIKERGKLAGIVINPDTSLETVREMLNLCDYVLFLTVNPGFSGQKLIEFTKDKLRRLVAMKEQYGFKVVIDGACTPAVIKELGEMGADGFVLGTSALFGKGRSYKEVMDELREL